MKSEAVTTKDAVNEEQKEEVRQAETECSSVGFCKCNLQDHRWARGNVFGSFYHSITMHKAKSIVGFDGNDNWIWFFRARFASNKRQQ